jgi:hypothetical protein
MSAAASAAGAASTPPAFEAPGRGCPIDYRYGPSDLLAAPGIDADVLWVVGGLYGNTEALAVLQALVAADAAAGEGRVEVVANGDFHWFDTDPAEFARIQAGVGRWHAMRGNVETELARAPGPGDADAGCGCGYPDSVPQEDVDRSNAMIVALRATARSLGAGPALAALPMLRRARVGGLRVGLVHGDDRSLAGWRLAHDMLAASRADGLDDTFDAAAIDLLACSHTCLPVAATFESARSGRSVAVINNGAAGMANFAGTTHGVVTRIARSARPAPAGARVLYRAALADCEVAAVAIDFDAARWLARFDAQWPDGSPAQRSYRARVVRGPAYSPTAAIRGRFRAVA